MSTDTKIPTPLYAAAGAGDLAMKQLRKLPARAAELRDKVAASDLDLDKLREIARRNAATLMSNAQVVYADLVKHGAEVVAARSGAVETEATEAANATDVKPVAAKPVKRQRAAVRK